MRFLKHTSLIFLLSQTIGFTQPLLLPPTKKVISFGHDNPSVEAFAASLSVMESKLPADGVGIACYLSKERDGVKTHTQYKMFSSWKWEKSWFTEKIELLKSVQPQTLKHNFLKTNSCCFTKGEFDFFNDEFWEGTYNNFAIMASIAKEAGLQGIMLDMEDYGNYNHFKYRPSNGKTFDETYDMVRKRGRGFIEAICKEYPDITIFAYFWLDLAFGAADNGPEIYPRLAASTTGLLVAFINGIYDSLPASANIVDGMESHGYNAKELSDYYRLRALREQKFKQLIAPENHLKLLTQTKLAIAIFLDYYRQDKHPPSFQTLMQEEQLTPIQLFRRNFYHVVSLSDEYIWLFHSAPYKWYDIQGLHSTFTTRAKGIAPEKLYWESALPGISEAIRFCKQPFEYARQKLETGQHSENLLKNPGFEILAGQKKDAENLSEIPDSEKVSAVAWTTWKSKDDSGAFRIRAGVGRNRSNAAVSENISGGSFINSAPVEKNQYYVVRACAKASGKAFPSLRIQWRDSSGKWCRHSENLSTVFSEELEDGWKRATLYVNHIPEGVAYLSPLLIMNSSGITDETCFFDDVEVFRLQLDSE